MNRSAARPSPVAVVVLLAALFGALGGGAAAAQETIRVTTAEELVRAIAPGRTVVLEPGCYDLSQAYRVQTRFVSWDQVYDGWQPLVHDVAGLTLRAELGAAILAEPRYSYTVSFLDCRNLLLEGHTLGHTEAGYCVGGVVRLERCEEVCLEGCELYGSGTVGIEITDTLGVTVRGSAIRDCTAGAVWAKSAAHLTFDEVEMLRNDSWPLIDIAGCFDVTFRACRLAENFGSALLSVDEDSRSVLFPGTVIERNATDRLVDPCSARLDLSAALIRENYFHSQEGEYEEQSSEADYYEGDDYDEGQTTGP